MILSLPLLDQRGKRYRDSRFSPCKMKSPYDERNAVGPVFVGNSIVAHERATVVKAPARSASALRRRGCEGHIKRGKRVNRLPALVVVGQSRAQHCHEHCQCCHSGINLARRTVLIFEYYLVFHNLLFFLSVCLVEAQAPVSKHSVVNNCRCQTMVHKRRNVEFGRDQS